MAKADALRRFFFPCFFPSSPAPTTSFAATATIKRRISTSLRDDLDAKSVTHESRKTDQDSSEGSPTSPDLSAAIPSVLAPPRPSKSMVIGTIFGQRRGHVFFCVQHDRLSAKPFLLLELSILTSQLVNEMRSGLVRIALESHHTEPENSPLRSVPVWTMSCNGRKNGFAARKKAGEQVRLMLKTMQSTTVGAGVIPPATVSESEEVMYMRANYEHVVGSADSEAFHLINPCDCPNQELSFFLLRSRNGKSRKYDWKKKPSIIERPTTSPFTHRVEVALRLKGLQYDFIDEDSHGNKSPLLLKSNPVHKKVPVLLHNGKPLPESLLILEYIDEVFGGYPLLPENPYDRAVARFWAKFMDDKALPALLAACWSEGAAQEKAVDEALSVLKILESELRDKAFFGGDRVGYVDVAANFVSFWFGIVQELAGVELLCSDGFPKLCQWRDEFVSASCVKETLPQRDSVLAIMAARFAKKK